jgi:hypothetical protein
MSTIGIIVAGLAQPVGPGHLVEVGRGFRAGPFASSHLADGPQDEHRKGTEAAGDTGKGEPSDANRHG